LLVEVEVEPVHVAERRPLVELTLPLPLAEHREIQTQVAILAQVVSTEMVAKKVERTLALAAEVG
jgi:hypothetical protein